MKQIGQVLISEDEYHYLKNRCYPENWEEVVRDKICQLLDAAKKRETMNWPKAFLRLFEELENK